MPASTDNPNILASANQIIQALLDMISEGFPIEFPEGAIQVTVNVTNEITNPGVASGGCGGCGGGTGTILPIYDPAEGQPPGGSGPGGGGTPPGYSGTDEQYDAHKCQAANFIWDSISWSFRVFGTLLAAARGIAAGEALGTWLVATITSMAATWTGVESGAVLIMLFLTGWEISLVVAAIAAVTVIAGVGMLTIFEAFADEWDSRKEDHICDLYNAQDVSEARTVIADQLTATISIFSITAPFDAYDAAIRAMLSTIASYFIPTALLNSLFSDGGAYGDMGDYESPNPVDCSVCSDGLVYIYESCEGFPDGTLVSGSLSGTFVVDSGPTTFGCDGVSDIQQIVITSQDNVCIHYEIELISGPTPDLYDGTLCDSSFFSIPGPTTIQIETPLDAIGWRLKHNGSTPFRIQVTVSLP